MSKKLNKADYRFKNLSDQTLEKKPGQINGIDFLLSKLDNCTVYLCDQIAAIYVDDCTNCKIYTGPIKGSIFVRDCKDIELSTAANQVRVSDTSNVKLFLYSHTDPTFEKVSSCQIGPYNFSYPKLREHVEAVGKLE